MTDPNQNQTTPDDATHQTPPDDLTTIKESIARLTEQLTALQSAPPVQHPVQQPVVPQREFKYIPDDEIEKAWDEGDTKRARKMEKHNADLRVDEALHRVRTEEIDPIRQAGLGAIASLTDRVLATKMKYLTIPQVKKTYESYKAQATQSGTILNDVAMEKIYNLAVGDNMDLVLAADREAFQRQQAATNVQTDAAKSSRTEGKTSDVIPKPEEYYSHEALELLKRVGRTPDTEAQRRGFADWDEYYTKVLNKK